jgi:hypothetical protein
VPVATHSVVTSTRINFSLRILPGLEGLLAGVPVPILVTEKNGVEPGVGLGVGVGAGSGEVCGTGAG